ncbi:hypothetical protein [Pseudomonas helleri]|uniref:hypothetical protein n=1 Tax=Pseudomonas helleri TaxID=1608996 RepID=UPI0028EC9737|nr:hypothetical protein [Pseudomonas helleri]
MAMSQEAHFRCVHCKNDFELTTEQVDAFMESGKVACPRCSHGLVFKEHDLAKLVAVKSKNRRRILMFGCLTIGLPLLNIWGLLQWGSGLAFLSSFLTFLVLVSAVPALKDVSFVRLDLEPENPVGQG